MENRKDYLLAFYGKGIDLFRIQVVNLILSIITIGLYYPWAKARKLVYLYSQTTFEQQPFVFTGTGKEMFRGFIKAFLFVALLYAALFVCVYYGGPFVQIALLLVYLIFLAIVPLVLHGSYRYRMAKTSWGGIRFGYTGNRSELVKNFLRDVFLTIITFGIYGAWLSMNLRRYMLSHIKVGNAGFVYKGNGGDYFILNLKGYFLTIITLGIYIFWWKKELFEYFVNHLQLEHGDKAVTFKSTATGGDFAALLIVNFLLLLITLGFGYSWVVTRTLTFIAAHIRIEGDIVFDELLQSQENYSDATGEDMSDFFDFGFVI